MPPAPDPRVTPGADQPPGADPEPDALGALWRRCQTPEVAGYELVGELGSGGQARVYRARAARTGALVAIKRWVDPHLDATAARRLEREVEALRRTDHPGVVRYLELVRDTLGCPCLVIELVEGVTLAEHLRQHGALPPQALTLLAFGLIDALAHVHARGVVHRDLKPHNVVLRRGDRRPVLVDFGIAHLAERSRVTAAGAPLGTRDYMAPEQYEGRGFVGPATDVYGLGATLLHAATGRWPIHHDAVAVLTQAGVPAALVSVIERCLRYRPEDRYSRADGALRAHVGALLETLPRAEAGEAAPVVEGWPPGSALDHEPRAASPPAPASPSPQRAAAASARRHPPELAASLRDEQRRCGAYVLLSELGRGGFGTVLRAWDLRHEREVALKLLEHLDPARRARFEREVKATARLAHPHIVPLLDSGEHRGRPFLVTELVRGRTLHALRAEGVGLDVPEAVRLVREVALALTHAHANGVLHRDVKPDNVLVDAAGRARLVDFGLARLEDRSRLTGTGLALGTAGYMPPEQLDGPDERLDPRADVYSLGATLYYMLSGEPPFRGETQREVYAQLACRDPEPPSRIDPRVSEELDTICLKCLEKNPRDRYGSAEEVADELLCVLEQRPIRARRPTAPARLRKWVRRNRALAATLGLAVLLALTGSVALVHQAERGAAALAAKEAEERRAAEARRRSAAEALEARVRAVEALLDRVAADASAVDLERALDELGRDPHPAMVALLARRLDLLTETLWDAQVALLLGAQPNEQERALGLLPIEGLATALAAWRALPLDGRPPDEVRAPIQEAGRRLVLRYRRRLRPEAREDVPTPVQQVVTAQEAALGAGGRALGPLLCRALGRLGVREGAVEAVARFLIVHPDAERSILPAQALATLGGPLAAAAIERQLERFEGRGPFAAVARPLLAQLGAPLDATEELTSADAYVERGKRRHLRGDLAGAVADFDAALAASPDHLEALNGRALAAWAAGDRAAAERALARLVELRPDSVAAWVNLGALRLERGDHRGTIAATSRTLELQPDHVAALTNRGLAGLHLGDLAAARVDLERAASLGSDEAATWTAYGQVLWHQGERQRALAAFDRALALDPRDAHALSHRGRLRAELGAAAEGEADVTQAVGLRPDLALAWFYRALIRRALGRRAEARSDLDQALACASPPPAAFTLRAYLRLDEGDAAGAVDDFDAALCAKRDAGAYTGRALALRRLGRTEQAQRDLERAIELAPDAPAPRVNLANLLVAKGDPAAALAAYEGAIRVAPHTAQAWSGLASAQLALGRFEEASRSARRALTLAPNEPMAHVNEGAALLHLGDAAGARASAARALALDPDLVQAWTLRAAAEGALGDHDQALRSADRALLLDPLHPEAWRVKGDALRHAHQLVPALAAYERFLELAPEHPNAADVNDLKVRLADLAARAAGHDGAPPASDAER